MHMRRPPQRPRPHRGMCLFVVAKHWCSALPRLVVRFCVLLLLQAASIETLLPWEEGAHGAREDSAVAFLSALLLSAVVRNRIPASATPRACRAVMCEVCARDLARRGTGGRQEFVCRAQDRQIDPAAGGITTVGLVADRMMDPVFVDCGFCRAPCVCVYLYI